MVHHTYVNSHGLGRLVLEHEQCEANAVDAEVAEAAQRFECSAHLEHKYMAQFHRRATTANCIPKQTLSFAVYTKAFCSQLIEGGHYCAPATVSISVSQMFTYGESRKIQNSPHSEICFRGRLGVREYK